MTEDPTTPDSGPKMADTITPDLSPTQAGGG